MLGTPWLEWLGIVRALPTYLIVAAAVFGGILLVRLAEKRLVARLKRVAAQSAGTLDDVAVDVLDRALLPLIYYGVFTLGIVYLDIPPWIERAVKIIGLAMVAFYGARVATTIISHAVNRSPVGSMADIHRVRVAVPIVQVAVWGLAVIFLLDNLGVQIGAVIAGLGIGGIAVALAAQAILGDLFSYVAIVFDRPFSIGDFIVVDTFSGTVEHIGIKTTRVRSVSGELIVFGNSNLAGARIRNFRSMHRRRVVLTFGVIYQTPTDTLERVPVVVRDILGAQPSVTVERVHFQGFSSTSLDFEAVYFVENPDFNLYMDLQQAINLELKRRFEQMGVEFAAPARAATPAAPTPPVEPVATAGGPAPSR